MTKKFPTQTELISAARQAHFPTNRRMMERAIGHPGAIRNILSLFPENATFENGVDFVTRCEELEMLIEEAHEAPKEYLRSPQE